MTDSKAVPKRPSVYKDRSLTAKSLSRTLDFQKGDLLSDSEYFSPSSGSEKVLVDEDEEGKEVKKRSSNVGKIYMDREEYLMAHRELTFDRNQLQIKNNILHRRLADYYKKRKLEHVLKPFEASMDIQEKYEQKLFSYQAMKEKEERECEELKTKLQEVTAFYTAQEDMAMGKFKVLQDHERNTGSGLIYAKKGKPISEKTVARFLSLQKTKMEQASAMTLRYIRVRNAVMEQEAIVRALERIGPGLYVAAYEQLRVDNLNYTNKIEERDDELIRNRLRCTEHNQILAHIREKMHHTSEVIGITECDYGDAEIDYQKAREELNFVKTRRDRLRIATENERLKAGLITKKILLRDFQDAIDTVEKLRDKKAYLERQIQKMNMELRQARRCIIHHRANSTNNDDIIY